MAQLSDPGEMRREAETLKARLPTDGLTLVPKARALLKKLNGARDYEAAVQLAEVIARVPPADPASRAMLALALIELGHATVALDVLAMLRQSLPDDDPLTAEAEGMIGRAWKDIFLAYPDPTTPVAKAAIANAFVAYEAPYRRNKAHVWHAVNQLACHAAAIRLKAPLQAPFDPAAVANEVIATLDATPDDKRDSWHWATVAEANIALANWSMVEAAVRLYASESGVQRELASTFRQFSRLWDLGAHPRGLNILAVLKARLLAAPGGEFEISAASIRRESAASGKDMLAGFEALLGNEGTETFGWWQRGLKAARAIASVQRGDERVGTAWLGTADMFGLGGADEQVAVTNAHVVNPMGEHPGFRQSDVELVFEAIAADARFWIADILWTSPKTLHDVTIMRLDRPVPAEPLKRAFELPLLKQDPVARVYVVGYPGGRSLAFSFKDNELLDHEGPSEGKPAIPGICRIHYRAPTEEGSSGSPVFNAKLWQVIGVHHLGGRSGMPYLNGVPGSYAANEAISIACIAEAIAKQQAAARPVPLPPAS